MKQIEYIWNDYNLKVKECYFNYLNSVICPEFNVDGDVTNQLVQKSIGLLNGGLKCDNKDLVDALYFNLFLYCADDEYPKDTEYHLSDYVDNIDNMHKGYLLTVNTIYNILSVIQVKFDEIETVLNKWFDWLKDKGSLAIYSPLFDESLLGYCEKNNLINLPFDFVRNELKWKRAQELDDLEIVDLNPLKKFNVTTGVNLGLVSCYEWKDPFKDGKWIF